ncbi:SCO family protein [Singulisphaera sp. PoT]|uniref:SCO family protein n=1 Tax=Singulisphaera sp. PoT TaxID=3411797 RepID=UPI003BF55BD5
MLRRNLSLAVVAALALVRGWSTRADEPKPEPKVAIEIDTTEVPDLKAWGEEAKTLGEEWYPKIVKDLKTDGYTAPSKIKIVFKNMEGVAGTSGDMIEVSAKWVREHPDDFGMVIHELTHVAQSYPKYRPSWVVEGIADYVRYYRYEPKSPRRDFDPQRSSYRNGYQPAAAFLVWLDETKHKGIIAELNQALRDGTCTEKTIEDLAGKPVNQLWKEFLEAKKTKEVKVPAAAAPSTSLPQGGGVGSASPLGDIGLAPTFSLTDSSGKPFAFKNLRGKTTLVSFVFTTCTGTCPATTQNLYRIQETLKKSNLWGDKVEFVSISLDPTRDTPEVLANYARIFRADLGAWHFLTGTPGEVSEVVRAWGMWAKTGPGGALDHPSRIFLVDPQGHEREIYSLEHLKPEMVLQDVKTLLAEATSS